MYRVERPDTLTPAEQARVGLRELLAEPGACKCPTRRDRRTGLHRCACCGFWGRLADHEVVSARLHAGDTIEQARAAGRRMRRTVARWHAASGWSPMVDVECWEHPRPPAEVGQLELFGGVGGPEGTWRWNEAPIPPAPKQARPAFTYYLGARPNWLDGRHLSGDVPLMVAAPTLARYVDTRDGARVPRRWGRWMGDSGAFMALTGGPEIRGGQTHPWWLDRESYGAFWTRIADDIGMPDFIAPQDAPCEPVAVERGPFGSVREHVEWTVNNFVWLRENYPHLPWFPVLTGDTPADYLLCDELYAAAGVDLAAEPLVGIGSICRRGSVPEIVAVVETFAAKGYRMHGFGIKVDALPVIGHLLVSADSYAWSDTARTEHVLLDGCRHVTRACARQCPADCAEHLTDCRNCPRWAQEWRRRVLGTLAGATPETSDPLAPVGFTTRRRARVRGGAAPGARRHLVVV